MDDDNDQIPIRHLVISLAWGILAWIVLIILAVATACS